MLRNDTAGQRPKDACLSRRNFILGTPHTAGQTTDTALNRQASGITDFGRKQAALGVRVGGLGPRRLKDIATPVELAAKLTARPKNANVSAKSPSNFSCAQ